MSKQGNLVLRMADALDRFMARHVRRAQLEASFEETREVVRIAYAVTADFAPSLIELDSAASYKSWVSDLRVVSNPELAKVYDQLFQRIQTGNHFSPWHYLCLSRVLQIARGRGVSIQSIPEYIFDKCHPARAQGVLS